MPNPLALVPSSWLWIVVAVLLAAVGGFGYGTYLGNQRLESYEDSVAAAGKAQESVVAYIVTIRKQIAQEEVDALKTRLTVLTRDNGVLLDSVRAHARRSHLPPATVPTIGDPGRSVVCFDRTKLESGLGGVLQRYAGRVGEILQRHGERSLAVTERGDRGFAALAACLQVVGRSEGLKVLP